MRSTINPPPRLRLAHLPTPIHQLDRFSRQVGRDIYMWRDDLTGFVESGNKVRKLEYLLAHALETKCDRILTAGGVQSNHTRTTAFLARRLGLKVALVVRGPKTGPDESALPTGNYLLNAIAGADVHHITYAEYQAAAGVYAPFLDRVAEQYRHHGERPYVIAEGGSVPRGCWGYINGVAEMLPTWKAVAGTAAPDSLFFADGSGGTHAGLHLGYEVNELSPRGLWAVNVCDSAGYFEQRVGKLVEATAQEFGLPLRERTLQVLDGHVGGGYGVASDDDLRFYMSLARLEGVLLDPVYTGKAFRGMLSELRKQPEKFGQKILFLHSGGGFATFAFQEQYARVLSEN
jgi:D-cysteine desulfhydrase